MSWVLVLGLAATAYAFKVFGLVVVGDRTIDVHIRKIRQKVGIDLITTVKGVGYKFEME